MTANMCVCAKLKTAVVNEHMFDDVDIDEAAELAAQKFKERLGL